jgi:hypothetical protein
MPLLATITFASSMLEDNDFFAPLLRRNLGFDPHASNGRHANCHLGALADKLHIGQCDCVTNGTREFFYINRVAWTHSILPTTRRHNRIHILSFSPQEQLYLILRRAVVGGTVSDQALAKLCQKWVVNVPHAGEDCQAGSPPIAYRSYTWRTVRTACIVTPVAWITTSTSHDVTGPP